MSGSSTGDRPPRVAASGHSTHRGPCEPYSSGSVPCQGCPQTRSSQRPSPLPALWRPPCLLAGTPALHPIRVRPLPGALNFPEKGSGSLTH